MHYNIAITVTLCSREQLTLPGVSAGSEQGDPVRDGVAKYQVTRHVSRVTRAAASSRVTCLYNVTCQGDAEASKRQVLGCDGVTADTRGLLQLVAAGNYRSAGNILVISSSIWL